jgi:von Willebrand factor A domain-containing protein 7
MPCFHGAARSVAEQATTTFLQGILDELAGNDEALAALLDLRGTIGFVVDDTGSMGPEISGVRAAISRVVNLLAGSPERKPDEWLLERFGDPDVGTPFVTPDASALLAAANALQAAGGGDCPELSQTGLLRSVEAALPQSTLFFYSDASAKDSGLARTVVRRAQDRRTRIIYALTGSCSPIDPAYVLGAAETGGQLFVLSSSEIDDLFALIEPQLTGDLATVLRRSGAFAGTPVTDTFPVDGTMATLLVSVTSDVKGPVVVRRPSGAVANAADPDVERLELSGGTVVRIDAPEVGEWSVELSGGGAWSLLAQGNSPLELYEVEFVEENDDIHGGYFAIAGELIADEDAVLEATILGPYLSGGFELVDQDGLPLAPVSLTQGFPGEDPENFLGELVPPNVPFRVVATGSDEDGNAYRREFPKVFRAQTVRVELEGMDDDTIVAGGSVGLDFEVTNLGAGGTFALLATDSLGPVRRPAVERGLPGHRRVGAGGLRLRPAGVGRRSGGGGRDPDGHPDRRSGRLQQRRRGARGLGQSRSGLRRPGRCGGEPLAAPAPDGRPRPGRPGAGGGPGRRRPRADGGVDRAGRAGGRPGERSHGPRRHDR